MQEFAGIIYHRLIGLRREQFVEEILIARQAYQSGQMHRGMVEELMAEVAT